MKIWPSVRDLINALKNVPKVRLLRIFIWSDVIWRDIIQFSCFEYEPKLMSLVMKTAKPISHNFKGNVSGQSSLFSTGNRSLYLAGNSDINQMLY